MGDDNLNNIVDFIVLVIDRLPNPPREHLKKEFLKFKTIIVDNRPPRILILGRRGAGKSSLVNAVFKQKVADVGSVVSQTGKAAWHSFNNNKGSLSILDTRGMGDGTRPEFANFAEALDEIKSEVRETSPDAILFLCKAKEVDAHIDKDIQNVLTIRKYISSLSGYHAPVAALVTQVDELDPKRVEPPYEDTQKQENIRRAVDVLQSAFAVTGIDLLKVIPISAYAEYEEDQRVYDNFWNIDVLIEYLMDVLPGSAQLQLARLSSLKRAQRKFARLLVGSTATFSTGIAATPISLADAIPITTAQIAMLTGISYISGREFSKKSAMEFLAAMGVNVGAGFAMREGARALIKFVFPGAGNVVSAAMAFAGTWGIGEAAISYFIENASIEEALHRFHKSKAKLPGGDN